MIDPLTIPAFRDKLTPTQRGAYLLVVQNACDAIGVAEKFKISKGRARAILNAIYVAFDLRPRRNSERMTVKLLRLAIDYWRRNGVANGNKNSRRGEQQ